MLFRITCFALFWAIVAIGVSTISAAEEVPLSIRETREVLIKYYRTHGGNARVSDLVNLKFDGKVTFQSRPDLTFPFRLYKKRPNLLRYELDLDRSQTWITGLNKGEFTQQLKTGRRTTTPEPFADPHQQRLLEIESMFDGFLWNLREKNRGVKVYREDPSEVIAMDTYRCEVFDVNPTTGEHLEKLATIWLDAAEYRAVQREIYAAEDLTLTSRFELYDTFGGFLFPVLIKSSVNGEWVSTSEITNVEVKPGTLDMFFRLR